MDLINPTLHPFVIGHLNRSDQIAAVEIEVLSFLNIPLEVLPRVIVNVGESEYICPISVPILSFLSMIYMATLFRLYLWLHYAVPVEK